MRIHAREEEPELLPISVRMGGQGTPRCQPDLVRGEYSQEMADGRSWQQEAFAQAILFVLGNIHPEATQAEIESQLAHYYDHNNNFYRALLTARYEVPTAGLSNKEFQLVEASLVNMISKVTEIFRTTYKTTN